jgi:hypothetical protein
MSDAHSRGLRAIEAEGSHYEVGKKLGCEFGDQIAGLFDNYGFFDDVLEPFMSKNPQVFESLVQSQKNLYPRAFDMLNGIADGSEVDIRDLAAYNLRGEIRGLTTRVDKNKNPILDADGTPLFNVEGNWYHPDGCCDMISGLFHVHNEDGNPAEIESSAYVDIIVNGKRLGAVVYAGAMVGNGATFLYSGDKFIAVTVDDVWGTGLGPLKPHVDYGGRQFAAAGIIDAENIDEVVKILVPNNRLSGFYYTVSSSDGNVVGVEVGPFTHHVTDISGSGKPYVHTNHHKHIEEPEYVHPSSKPREERVNHLLAARKPNSEKEILEIMFDQNNQEYEGKFQMCRTNPEAEGKLGLHHLWTSVTDLHRKNTNIYMLDDDKKAPVLVQTINHNHYL